MQPGVTILIARVEDRSYWFFHVLFIDSEYDNLYSPDKFNTAYEAFIAANRYLRDELGAV